jgi:hypothetical protein
VIWGASGTSHKLSWTAQTLCANALSYRHTLAAVARFSDSA